MRSGVQQESEIVRRAQSGDRAAFGSLYDSYLTPIYDFSLGMLRNRSDAEDVTSETFLKAVERIGSLKDPKAFKGWLYQIARNSALDLIESRKKAVPVAEHVETARTADEITLPDPEARAETEDVRALLGTASAALNPRDYSVYELVVRHGMNSAELADALDVRQPYAYILMNRLKGSVTEALEATLLARTSRSDCADLDAVLTRVGAEPSPRMRKAVLRHAKSCEVCGTNRRTRASVPALLSGMAFASPSAAFAAELTSRIDAHWTTHGPGSGTGSGGSDTRNLARLAGAGAVVVALTAFVVGAGAQRTINHPEVVPDPTPAAEVEQDATPTPSPLRSGGRQLQTPAPVQTPVIIIDGFTPGSQETPEPDPTSTPRPTRTPPNQPPN
jgi:RNA polymerase sigma factor (sigma-70 family)